MDPINSNLKIRVCSLDISKYMKNADLMENSKNCQYHAKLKIWMRKLTMLIWWKITKISQESSNLNNRVPTNLVTIHESKERTSDSNSSEGEDMASLHDNLGESTISMSNSNQQ